MTKEELIKELNGIVKKHNGNKVIHIDKWVTTNEIREIIEMVRGVGYEENSNI